MNPLRIYLFPSNRSFNSITRALDSEYTQDGIASLSAAVNRHLKTESASISCICAELLAEIPLLVILWYYSTKCHPEHSSFRLLYFYSGRKFEKKVCTSKCKRGQMTKWAEINPIGRLNWV